MGFCLCQNVVPKTTAPSCYKVVVTDLKHIKNKYLHNDVCYTPVERINDLPQAH